MTKTYNDFLYILGERESGGYAKLGFTSQYLVVNKPGFLGKYQMGEQALDEAGYYP